MTKKKAAKTEKKTKTTPKAKEERTDIRTTVSLAGVIYDKARAQMKERGFNDNFSAYVADMIRNRDTEASVVQIQAALERLEGRHAR